MEKTTHFLKQLQLLFLFFSCTSVNAQIAQIEDSMNFIINNPNSHDTTVARAYVDLGSVLFYTNFDTLIPMSEKGIYIARAALKKKTSQPFKNSLLNTIAIAFGNMSYAYQVKGELDKSKMYIHKCLNIQKSLKDKKGMSVSLTTIGYQFETAGNLDSALFYYHKSLKLKNEVNDLEGKVILLMNIAYVFKEQDEYEEALKYAKEYLEIQSKLDGPIMMVKGLNFQGTLYLEMGNLDSAYIQFSKAMKLSVENNFQAGIANVKVSFGKYYNEKGEFANAIRVLKEGLLIGEEINSETVKKYVAYHLSKAMFGQGSYAQAKKYALEAYQRALDSGIKDEKMKAAKLLYEIESKLRNDRAALNYYEIFIALENEIKQEKNMKALFKKQYQFDYEKQAAIDSIQHLEDKKVQDALLAKKEAVVKQQKQRAYFLYSGLVLTILFGIFIFNRFKVTQKQKVIIEKQKNEVELAYVDLDAEKEKSEELLLNILPEEVAQELKEKGHADAQLIDFVTVLFTDFKGFTALSEILSPQDLVKEINVCFSAFDRIMDKHNIEKIKTIGDAYMAAGGLPTANETHALDVVLAALDIQQFMLNLAEEKKARNEPFFEIRIGVHTGPVVAGIVGVKKFQYDIWGDTVNTASRMESSGEVGMVNISESTYDVVKSDARFVFESRGKVQAKGKGLMEMFFISRK